MTHDEFPVDIEAVSRRVNGAPQPALPGLSHSPEIGELAKALAAARGSFRPVKRRLENTYYRSKYADLAEIIECTEAALAANGLSVIQSPRLAEQEVGVTTMLVHSSGQWLRDELRLPAAKADRFDPQTVGSAITYARRYALQAMLNIAADSDDDGNEASGVGSQSAAPRAREKGDIAVLKPSAEPNRGHGREGLTGSGLRATLTDAQARKTAKGAPYALLKFGARTVFCFDEKLASLLLNAKGKRIEAEVEVTPKGDRIADVFLVGEQRYENGEPVIQQREFEASDADLPDFGQPQEHNDLG